jgi:ribosomal protein L37AE/L43A
MAKQKVKFVCSDCGGDNVTRDATAKWDEATQEWVTVGVQDAAICEDCGVYVDLKEVPIKTWDVTDCGVVGADNAVWTHCENIEARDTMEVGTSCLLNFKTGQGRNSVVVNRLT